MDKETLQAIEQRLATLEKAVAALTNEKKTGNEPRAKFADIGGIERHPARSVESPQIVELSEAYGETGRRVR